MQKSAPLGDSLLKQYGPLMGGAELYRSLGFRSAAAFQRAVRDNALSIRIFAVPGRRGKFALTADVAAWLSRISDPSEQPVCPESQGGKGGTTVAEPGKAGEEVEM